MTPNSISLPQIVSFNCPTHGQRLQAPAHMTIECFCGKRCEIDLAGWAALMAEHYPGKDIEALAVEAGFPVEARAALADGKP